MSARNRQKASRKATRAGRRDVLRRACQSVVGAPDTSRWESLETRVMMSINQIDPTYVAFEAETADAVITPGAAGSTWAVQQGDAAAGVFQAASGGKSLTAVSEEGRDV